MFWIDVFVEIVSMITQSKKLRTDMYVIVI